jgi:N-acetylglucosaminyldiphosphoundecaprenol N-acetyl-beta-D-mannosaminyltransferase
MSLAENPIRSAGHFSLRTRLDAIGDRWLNVLGVRITDVDMPRALEIVQDMIHCNDGRTRGVYFVNAHALNLAVSQRAYREVLNAGDCVFGDGTGVRWAARLQGVHLRDNVNGTDLVPALLNAGPDFKCRYFLLGTDEKSIRIAAEHARAKFPNWTLAGFHHGYLNNPEIDAQAVSMINRAQPDLLLVGMGNPLQELWIHNHRNQLRVPLCMGVGGLFQYWAGTLQRAPRWLRGRGFEWLGIMAQQPKKAGRYVVGNPLFLARILREAWTIRRQRRRHGRLNAVNKDSAY